MLSLQAQFYEGIRRLTDTTICSGANRDDLGEYRPGLDAAPLFDVRHPYIETGFTKMAIRRLAACSAWPSQIFQQRPA